GLVVDVDRPGARPLACRVRHRHVRVEDEAELDDPEHDEEQRHEHERELDEALAAPYSGLSAPYWGLSAPDRTPRTRGTAPTRASGWVVSCCASAHRARAGLPVVLAGRVCVAHGRPEMAPWSRSGYPTRAVISAVAA